MDAPNPSWPRWRLVDDAAGTAIEFDGARAPLDRTQSRCLRQLIARQREGSSLPELHGFVVSVRLLGDDGGCTELVARAVIRSLRSCFTGLGLYDMIVEHERFGFKLRVPPDDPGGASW